VSIEFALTHLPFDSCHAQQSIVQTEYGERLGLEQRPHGLARILCHVAHVPKRGVVRTELFD
jgi:hypothetical protein